MDVNISFTSNVSSNLSVDKVADIEVTNTSVVGSTLVSSKNIDVSSQTTSTINSTNNITKVLGLNLNTTSSIQDSNGVLKRSLLTLSKPVVESSVITIAKRFINRISKFFNVVYIKALRQPIYKITFRRRRY